MALSVLGVLAFVPAPAPQAPTAAALIRRAVTAMGGEPALRGVTTVAIEYNSVAFGLGQEETPLSPARIAGIASGRTITDWRANRRLTVQELRQNTGALVRGRQVLAENRGMTEQNGVQAPTGPAAVAGALGVMRQQPDRLLLRALDHPAAVTGVPARVWRGELMDGVRFAHDADTLTLYFDRPTGLLTVSELITDDGVLGDRRDVTWYTKWQAAGEVKLPRQIDVYRNDRMLSQNQVTSLVVNGPVSDTLFAIPDSIARRAQPAAAAAPPVVTVNLVELAPSVWRAEGGSHHSLVVEQATQLVVVEAPQSGARFRAVLDTLKSRFPSKPVGLVVSTHHHWDHSGGLRAAMAAGLRVATERRNVAFVRGIAAARKTVAPDALSRRQVVATVIGVTDSLVIGTGERRVVLYQLPTAHAEGVLAAYVPSARLLFTSDVLTAPAPPAPPPAPGSAEMVAFAKSRGIAVDRYAGGHGAVVAWAEVERAGGGR